MGVEFVSRVKMLLSPTRFLSALHKRPASLVACKPINACQFRTTHGARLKALRASTQEAPSAVPATAPPSRITPGEYLESTNENFAVSKVSFGSILTPIGLILLGYGFCAYFADIPGSSFSSLMLVYGFPVTLLGFALSYAQLNPVTCKTTKAAYELRASQMTDIQKQVREDTTRFRYGDEQHLEEALEKIFKYGRSGGVQRKFAPILTGLREEVVDGMYTLVLEFSTTLDLTAFQERLPKFQSFFGPGVVAYLEPRGSGVVDVLLVADGTGAGRGGGEKKDPLMPLLPGLKARPQDGR